MPDLPRFPDNRSILWKARTWNKVARILERWKPVGGTGIDVDRGPGGSMIHTNGGTGSLTHEDCEGNRELLMEWEAGLLKTIGAKQFVAGCGGGEVDGADLNLTIITEPVSLVSIATTDRVMVSASGSISETHYWRNGLYIGTTDPDGRGAADGVIVRSVTYLSF